jgi:hypothetical protein
MNAAMNDNRYIEKISIGTDFSPLAPAKMIHTAKIKNMITMVYFDFLLSKAKFSYLVSSGFGSSLLSPSFGTVS